MTVRAGFLFDDSPCEICGRAPCLYHAVRSLTAAERRARERQSRDAQALALYRAGATLQAIADEIGLSRERVRQIIVRTERMANP